MSAIKNYISIKNDSGKKVLSIFLTAGYPSLYNFIDLAKTVINSGADMIELGIPFSDPLADGPTIQKSSQWALDNGVNLRAVLKYCEQIKSITNIPIILMGYSNPILKYGYNHFLTDAVNSGADGLIVPDIPLEEYDSFFSQAATKLDVILLTTPTSSNERIKKIDEISKGFVYCVSVTGTTGVKESFSESNLKSINRTREQITNNKMLIGFGISKAEDVKQVIPFCDGVIVGSAVINSLKEGTNFALTEKLIKGLSDACLI